MKPADGDLTASLRSVLRGRVCVVGVGNRQRGDDGAGPRLIDSRPPGTQGAWLDAGVAPENFLEPIVKTNPDTVLIIDAVDFGGFPGERRRMDVAALDAVVLSTHAGSLAMLGEYLTARTGACIHVLAIQPETIETREGLSPAVDESVRELAAMLAVILVASTGEPSGTRA